MVCGNISYTLVKKCSAFLVGRLAERDEILHDDRHWSVAACDAIAVTFNLVLSSLLGIKTIESGYLAEFLSERDEIRQR